MKIEIIKNKRKYLVAAMEFRRRKSEEKEKKRKSRIKYATGWGNKPRDRSTPLTE